jgi:hypothetical protein
VHLKIWRTRGDNTLVSGVAGQTVLVYQMFLVVDANTTLIFKDGSTVLDGQGEAILAN